VSITAHEKQHIENDLLRNRLADVRRHAESGRKALVGHMTGTANADIGQAHRDICAILSIARPSGDKHG
jgi:hypothetical protein